MRTYGPKGLDAYNSPLTLLNLMPARDFDWRDYVA